MLASHACSAFWRWASFATPVACADHRNDHHIDSSYEAGFRRSSGRKPSQGTFAVAFAFVRSEHLAGARPHARLSRKRTANGSDPGATPQDEKKSQTG